MKNIALLCALAAAPLLTAFVNAQENYPAMPFLPVVAHRGFSAIAPENTLSSMKAGIEVGASGCEMDIYQTKDGVMYLNHDGTLERIAGAKVKASDVTFEELRKLDAGAWKGEQFKGEKYPTLDEALELLSQSDVYAVIEIKADGFEEKLIESVRAHKMEKQTVLIDFSANRVKKFRQIAPDIPCAWLVSFDEKVSVDEACAKIEQTLKECGTNVVDMLYTKACPELLERLAAGGIEVMVWTVDNPQDIARLYGYGVRSITTNRPDLALEALNEGGIKGMEK
ncbi:MAG: hypothetical protein IIZ25_08515 [Thermoguttaceae bacterium]|nr:hypothetical protein [Thermoguttaceae bacterium]